MYDQNLLRPDFSIPKGSWYKCTIDQDKRNPRPAYEMKFFGENWYICPSQDSKVEWYNPLDDMYRDNLLYDLLNLAREYPRLKENYDKYSIERNDLVSMYRLNYYSDKEKLDIQQEENNQKFIQLGNEIIEKFTNKYGMLGVALQFISHTYPKETDSGISDMVFTGLMEESYDHFIKTYLPQLVPPYPEYKGWMFWKNFSEPISDIIKFLGDIYNNYLRNITFTDNAATFYEINSDYIKKLVQPSFSGTNRPYISPMTAFPHWDDSRDNLTMGYGFYSLTSAFEFIYFQELCKRLNKAKGILVQCKHCGKFFSSKEKEATFHDDDCRTKYYTRKTRLNKKPLSIIEMLLDNKYQLKILALSRSEIPEEIVNEIKGCLRDKSFVTNNRIKNIIKVYRLYKNGLSSEEIYNLNEGKAKDYVTQDFIDQAINIIKEMEDNISGQETGK